MLQSLFHLQKANHKTAFPFALRYEQTSTVLAAAEWQGFSRILNSRLESGCGRRVHNARPGADSLLQHLRALSWPAVQDSSLQLLVWAPHQWGLPPRAQQKLGKQQPKVHNSSWKPIIFYYYYSKWSIE